MTLLLDISSAQDAVAFTVRRPIPADRPGIEAMYERCTLDSRYKRFHGIVPVLPKRYLDACLAGAPDQHDAVVAVAGGRVVGLASAAPNGESHTIELGSLVEDAWQRLGVGRALLQALLTNATARGVRQVRFEVLYENGWLAAELAKQLDVVESSQGGGEISLLCRIRA